MSKQDYYETLGVSRQSSADEIKKSYRRLAMKYHPDRNKDNPDAEKKFKYINEAYSILSDPEKKQAYDQFGHAGVDGAAGGAGPGHGGFDFNQDIFGKIFEEFVGGNPFQGQSSQQKRGSDLIYTLQISLEEAIKGCNKEIKFTTLTTCDGCDGKGGTGVEKCSYCNGVGQVRLQQGFINIQQTCPRCQGEGTTIKHPCTKCNGKKRINKSKKIQAAIPAGVDTGNRIRFSGQGESGYDGGPAGDLYVEVQVTKHPIFTRKEQDLHCEIPIQFTQACLGDNIEVPTIDGKVSLKIPKETQNGATLRLRGKGVRNIRSNTHGDLICKIKIETPIKLDQEQQELLQKFADSIAKGGDKHKPQAATWYQHLKQFIQKLTT